MSITTEVTRIVFTGDGNDNSPYAIAFPLRDDDSVEVIYVTDSTGAEVVKTKTTDYTIAVAADFGSATLTLVTTAPATGETLLIRRNEPATRLSNYSNFDGQPSGVTNSDYDKSTMADQTLQEQLDRAIVIAKGHPDADLPISPINIIAQANKAVIVNATEDGFTFSDADLSDLVSGSGTLNTIPLWTPDGDTLGDSVITQASTQITIAGTLIVSNALFDGRTAGALTLSHTSHTGTSDYAVEVAAAGATRFNSVTGFSLQLAVGDVAQVTVTSTNVEIISDDFIVKAGQSAFGEASIATSAIVSLDGSISIKERATAVASTAAYGQIWVLTATPNVLMFTDDAGNDHTVSGLSGAGTLNAIPLWTPSGAVLGDSVLTQSGTVVTASGSGVGQVVGLAAVNSDNTVIASHARLNLTAGGSAGGDAYIHFLITGADSWAMGIDNTDSDQFKIAKSATLGTGGDQVVLSGTTFEIVSLNLDVTAGNLEVTAGKAGFGGVVAPGPLDSAVGIHGNLGIVEQAAADGSVATWGQIWVKNTTPNELWFTDDAGTDVQLGLAGGGGAIDGSGTVGTIPIFVTDTTTIGDSVLTDSGTVFTLAGRDLTLDSGDLSVGGDATVTGLLAVASQIQHVGNTSTNINFTSDRIQFSAGGASLLELRETTQNFVKVNNNNVDVDFIVNTISQSDTFFIDGATHAFQMRGPAGGAGASLTLMSNELTNVDGDVLGQINFQAPLDSAGTDAILVTAWVRAEADATFSSTVNTTSVVIATATDGAAVERLRINATETFLTAIDLRLDTGDINVTAGDVFISGGDLFVGAGTPVSASGATIEIQGPAAGNGLLLISTAETTVVDTDILGRIDFRAPASTGGSNIAAAIVAVGSGTWGVSDNPTDIYFATNTVGDAVERMRITDVGNVGIGIDPGTLGKLVVDQASASGAIPVLTLDQGDIDDVFMNLIGTSAADSTRSISSSTAEAAAKFGAYQVEINGTAKWVRIYDSAV